MARKTPQAGSEEIPTVVDLAGAQPANFAGTFSSAERFALINKLIYKDLNGTVRTPTFSKYTKDDITTYIGNPYQYEKQLRDAIVYIYGASAHFRALIDYFAGLSDLAYVVAPYKIDPKKANKKTINNNYRKVLNILSSMSVKTQFPKILHVCWREDVFYGTMWVTADSITIQQLDSEFCKITTVENNVPNVTFDFSYFDSRLDMIDFFPPEFKTKYELYRKDRKNKWIELDAPTSFAVKSSSDILDYPLPPLAGILREIYDIEDYKTLRLTKTALENYAMIVMKLPMADDGAWLIDEDKAKEFWRNLDGVLPDEIGSILTPMVVDKIDFEKSNTGDADTIAEAEQDLFTAAGVSSLLFNNDKASANALLLSIKADQNRTFKIVRGIQDVVNRYIQYQSFGKNFKVEFLNTSEWNRKEVGDMYLKAATYGLPTISMYAASQGLGQAELDSMSFLEADVLGLPDMFRPIVSSNQMSNKPVSDPDQNPEGGAPTKDAGELTDSGETSRENSDDW